MMKRIKPYAPANRAHIAILQIAMCAASAFVSTVGLAQGQTPAQPDAFCQAPLSDAARRTVVIAQQDRAAIIDHPSVDFSFARTMRALAQTGGGVSAESLLSTMIATFSLTQVKHPVDGRIVKLTPRKAEAKLTPAALLDPSNPHGMRPVALFNRFDRAPQNWKYCGEHRIVYARNSTNEFDRFFLIFEAAVRNPKPQDGFKGCLPIARFWNDLGKGGLSTGQMAKRLEDFYYKGLDVDGDGATGGTLDIPPVLHADHFGMSAGQIRANMFMHSPAGQQPWELREWLLNKQDQAFKMNPVQDNPEPFLYKDRLTSGDSLSALLKQFQDELTTKTLASLLAAETGQKPHTPHNIITSIGADFGPSFDGFSSNSQNALVSNPQTIATAEGKQLKARLQVALNAIPVNPARPLPNVDQLLNRAGVVSCAGCHHLQNNAPIAPERVSGQGPVLWPLSDGRNGIAFVHVNEKSELSPALIEHLLPARCENIQTSLQDSPAIRNVPSSTGSASAALSNALSAPVVTGRNSGQSGARILLNSVITEERRIDRATPGAFLDVRRSH